MAKTVTLAKEKRTIYKCTINGEECYYVVFVDTFKETTANIFGGVKERVYDVTEKSLLRFETKEKAEQYSRMVAKCDTLGEVECGETTYDTYTVPVILIYPKHHEALADYGCFGCIKDDINKSRRYASLNGFTFFPYLTTNKLYCDIRHSGCLSWYDFAKLEDGIVRHYIKTLKLNIDFPDDKIISYDIIHVPKEKIASMSAQESDAELKQAIEDMEGAYSRFVYAARRLGISMDETNG